LSHIGFCEKFSCLERQQSPEARRVLLKEFYLWRGIYYHWKYFLVPLEGDNKEFYLWRGIYYHWKYFLVPLEGDNMVMFNKDSEAVWSLLKKRNQPRYLEDGTIYFPTRRSLTVTVLTCFILLLLLVSAGATGQLFPFILLLGIALLIWRLDSNTGYTISDTHLVIKYALFRRKIGLTDLRMARHTTNPLSSLALSLKRLEVITDSDLYVVSPVEEALFLKTLKERSPSLIMN
jgi:hypothetical protein